MPQFAVATTHDAAAVTEATGLTRHGSEVKSVFDLLGRDENDLTAALGFTLARSPELLRRVAARLLPGAAGQVGLQLEVRDDLGRTDLELTAGGQLAVVEAKRGWLLPDPAQLAAYAPRVRRAGGGVLVTLSEASLIWAGHVLPPAVAGVPVMHLPWSDLRAYLGEARAAARGGERHWLNELHTYLERALPVREPHDARTYCVVVSQDRPGEHGPRTFRDYVDSGEYFHPHGRDGWPNDPPNFLAFRWDNYVQRIHRVTRWEVIPDLQTRWPEIPVTDLTQRPHVAYTLGPPLPGTPIPSGINYRANRVWVLLDQLLLGPTLQDALRNTDTLITV